MGSETEVSPQKSDQKQSLKGNKIKVDMHSVI